jgi:orotidine-5'-phosphate decarboxylase
MSPDALYRQILAKRSYLCVGLDTDISKIPPHLLDFPNPLLEFNKAVIEVTQEYCVSYKLNLAFYESAGENGWEVLQKTIDLIPSEILIIADGKRADIGNSSAMYAKSAFNTYNFDAATVHPYMGKDSIDPFLNYEDKYAVLLALTSNSGSADFQKLRLDNGNFLYEEVLQQSAQWGGPDKLMYVVGATHPEEFKRIRELVPDHFLLVPGVGAQGGDLESVSKNGFNDRVGLLVNSSRSIIYAGSDEDYAIKARDAAKKLQMEMSNILDEVEMV